jgi:alcohol dehydrogenase class IV
MPYVLAFNRPAIEERLARLAGYIGLAEASFAGFLDWIVELRRQLGIPTTLAGLGVAPESLDRLAAMAEQDPSAGGNPRPFGAAEARQVLDAAMAGRLG